MKVIGIMGALGSGKSTVAKQVAEDFGYTRLRMADPLKDMLKAAGLTHGQVDGADKNTPAAILDGVTPRWAMQTLGTEWGRKLISPNLWVIMVKARIIQGYGQSSGFVIDDIRFPNEIKMIQALGGELWVIRRPEVEPDLSRKTMFLRGLRAAIEALPGMRWNCTLCDWLGWPKPIHSSELYWKGAIPYADVVIENTGSEADLRSSVQVAMIPDSLPSHVQEHVA